MNKRGDDNEQKLKELKKSEKDMEKNQARIKALEEELLKVSEY